MSALTLQRTGQDNMTLLNFVVVGDVRSGSHVVQSTINNRGAAICHQDLFNAEDAVRRFNHEDYFGPSADPDRSPEWFFDECNPNHYINTTVLDNPQRAEKAVGFRVLYDFVRRYELWELFAQRCREGDFCVVHTTRNPVACFISYKQAEMTKIWRRDPAILATRVRELLPPPVQLDPAELIEFCHQHTAMQRRITDTCPDILEVTYRDLLVNYQQTSQRIFEFLELTYSEQMAVPGCQRLYNRSMLDRISNYTALRLELPSDILALLHAEDFI